MSGGSAPTIRAFLAVPLSVPLRDALAALQRELAPALRGVRWTPPASIHLTLQFFAGLPIEVLDKLRTSVLSVTIGSKPFGVDVRGLGVFPAPQRPRVLWAGLDAGPGLAQFYRDCAEGLAAIGLPVESRPFRPHLTIGRFREGPAPGLEALLDRESARPIGTLPVERLVLYRSELGPAGATHTELFAVPLSSGDD